MIGGLIVDRVLEFVVLGFGLGLCGDVRSV